MYMDITKDKISNIPDTNDSSIYNILDNPIPIVVLVAVVFFYMVFFYTLKSSSTSIDSSSMTSFLEIIFGIIFIILVFVNATLYYFNVDVTATFSKLFTKMPKVSLNLNNKNNDEQDGSFMKDIKNLENEIEEYASTNPETNNNSSNGKDNNGDGDDNGDGDNSDGGEFSDKEVFHIPGAYYTYDDSKAICKAYGGKLASYNQLEEVYKNGGEWCSYGWSKDQQILYPTQKKTYNKLQKIPGHEHDCGRQGINGGYVANKNARFGVNCYGVKPEIKKQEKKLMKKRKFYPVNPEQIREKRLVDHWRKQLPSILISPYNKDEWNK